MRRQQATPQAIRYIPPSREPDELMVPILKRAMADQQARQQHRQSRGCLTATVEFLVIAACLVILLALMGTGPW